MHAEKNGPPLIDASNDLELISSSEADGVTSITFQRKIATCDNDDNIITVSVTIMVNVMCCQCRIWGNETISELLLIQR